MEGTERYTRLFGSTARRRFENVVRSEPGTRPVAPAVLRQLFPGPYSLANSEVGSGNFTLVSAVRSGIWAQVPALSS
jgi:hypothetical protein